MKESLQQEFEQLINYSTPKLLKLAMGVLHNQEDARDICQESFIQLFETTGIREKEAWLYRTVLNRSINLKKQKEARKVREEETSQEEALKKEPFHILAHQEQKERLNEKILTLPEGQKNIFLLRHQASMPIKEIASLLGISEGSVKKQLSRALEKLRTQLQLKGNK